ncbi:mitochondrial amidoxime-reducing component 1 [Parasteatoda tepidariorum]|uniref:mitochondrial amidoxime-reducing component 1 n=1 Tax=Parasteatoda tepidariorum TaxID=114398 RepID=UPI00077FA0E9|nr:mitochondrial amidoxime-reducing component 1 [Parasteatoda tepidariorum]
MPQLWNGWIILPVLAVAVIGTLVWKKKRRVYEKVGYVSKMFFFPVKSIKGYEVTEGKCTKFGLEVNGLLERSFMLIDENNVLLSQRQAPKLALLAPQIIDSKLIISGPDVDPLTVDIESSPKPGDKIIECQLHSDVVHVIDCGDKVAKWFQQYLKRPNIRLVRFFPENPKRNYVQNHPFYLNLRRKNPISLQDLSAFHVMSQASIDDLNLRIGEKKISVWNFRPSVLVDGCAPYAEDSWEHMRTGKEAEMVNVLPITRCLLTTVDPETGILTSKEPLVTLRKYRIPKDPEMVKKTGSIPCLGSACFILKTGTIRVNDEIHATVTQPFTTIQK